MATSRLPRMDSVLQDVRFSVRALANNPGFAAIAILTLALGIGANSAIYSLVDGILLRPLPYPHPDELVSVTGSYPKGGFAAMRDDVRTMDVASYSEGHQFNVTGQGEPFRLNTTSVSGELMTVLGVRAELGRTFNAGDDRPGLDAMVLLSHAAWEQRFGQDPSIVGRPVVLDGVSRQIIGVMPPDFAFPSRTTDVWIPLRNEPANVVSYWAGDFMPVIGRLRPGSTVDHARAEIRLFQPRVSSMFPWTMPADWNRDVSVIELRQGMVTDVRGRLLMLLGAVALVLLIACANVANLTLSRAASREKEMAIRSALGAGRGRLAGQLLTESVVLASLGGLVGLGFAAGGVTLLKSLLPAETPRLLDVQLDWRVVGVTSVVAVVSGLVFGLLPALQVSRGVVVSGRTSGRGTILSVSQRLRNGLVLSEVALAVLLVIGAGLLIRSLWTLSHLNPGFHSEQVVTARITPNDSFCRDVDRCLAFYRTLVDNVRAAPGVTGAALVNTPPLGGQIAKRSIEIEGYVAPPTKALPLFWLDIISPDYFRVMGIPMLAGSAFSEADYSGNPPVAIVSAATARRFWSDGTAIGRRIRFVGETDWRTVVGVVTDVHAYDLERAEPEWIEGTAYVPWSPRATVEGGRVPAQMTIAVRTASTQAQVDATLRGLVRALNPEAPVSDVRTMQAAIQDAVAAPASTTSLFAMFAAVALLMGLVGIYGVVSYLVSRRTREIGIRVALGASRQQVLWLVIREGAMVSAAGIAIGLLAALVLTRALSSELHGVSPLDPVTYGSVAIVMAVVTLAACAVPTRRALRVDPLVALRNE
jgi:predicted permease